MVSVAVLSNGGQIRVSQKKLEAFKQRASEIFRRNRGRSMQSRYAEFHCYALDWLGYFALDQVKSTFVDLDKWLRRRVRACYWNQWRRSKTRLAKLTSLGLPSRVARGFAMSGKGVWRLSSNDPYRTSISPQWACFSSHRAMAIVCIDATNRPVRTRMLRWCGRGPQQCGPYPDTDCSSALATRARKVVARLAFATDLPLVCRSQRVTHLSDQPVALVEAT